jgi:hypothetical protein
VECALPSAFQTGFQSFATTPWRKGKIFKLIDTHASCRLDRRDPLRRPSCYCRWYCCGDSTLAVTVGEAAASVKQHFQLLDSQLPILTLAPSLLLLAAVVVVLGFAALAAAAFGAGLPFVVLFCCAAADASSTLTFRRRCLKHGVELLDASTASASSVYLTGVTTGDWWASSLTSFLSFFGIVNDG